MINTTIQNGKCAAQNIMCLELTMPHGVVAPEFGNRLWQAENLRAFTQATH